MSTNLLARYIWIVDTIRRHGRISRSELDAKWRRSPFSVNGEGLPRRTFYNYRQAIEELFNMVIECDGSTFEYYIANNDSHSESVSNWLLNSVAVSDVLSNSRDVASSIFLENVPSARQWLSLFINAMREYHYVRFTYNSYTRSRPTPGVVLEPYFLKIFKQRWYVTGRVATDNKVKTYALDRITECVTTPDRFIPDPAFDAQSYFRDSFGIVFSQNEPKRIALKADPLRAKYLRALPLHHSQSEIVHDHYSIFYYRMRITPDLVEEILSHGPRLTVLEPPELRVMVQTELRQALQAYEGN
ncbi:MAG: WYL domain-containing protein [Muribaculaceae bacterium]|nr:WYL domain-containing protein [Muribaculaceae bacterium]MDE6487042.1 WYL domain-containing protein [Muribaculaceae bacterium]